MRQTNSRLGESTQTTVWTGRRLSVAGAAVGHRLPSVSYRATSDWLYWTTGRFSGRYERAPLWAVRDAELRQSLQQRARRVGDLVVSLQHRDYLDKPTFVVLQDIDHPHEAHRRITEAARACRRRHDGNAADA